MDLEALISARTAIDELDRLAPQSIRYFFDEQQRKFTITDRDRGRERAEGDTTRTGRLTTSATCLETLLECSQRTDLEVHDWAIGTLKTFTVGALRNTPKQWVSEEAAWVYCRVRTLGSVLRLCRDFRIAFDADAAAQLVKQAWRSHAKSKGIFGLREATTPRFSSWAGPASPEHYPENAYLTYWGILAKEHLEGVTSAEQDERVSEWMTNSAATQVVYHYNQSPLQDPQQLIWSLAGIIKTRPNDVLLSTSPTHEIVKAGLSTFFGQQDGRGEWARGAALFHYPQAGNAYCYIYETLGEFLSLALLKDNAASETLRHLLRPYLDNFLCAFRRVVETGQRLGEQKSLVGWSSGHHPHRLAPESWATASVYRFLDTLRRLVGLWASDESKAVLGARRPREDLSTIRLRGGTWDIGSGSAGGQFTTMFVHPLTKVIAERQINSRYLPDPDESILTKNQAHSALLFGPPGTGKTTLVESIAGALSWDFVEITPAQFLDEGVDRVSTRADEIFRHVMQLNECVVLLDEIDELIQIRDKTADPMERFFTTTMLPRLANLWRAGKVLFFVNTNGILQVDPAIRRSQRFDAVIMVMPPGFDAKSRALRDAGISLQLKVDTVDSLLMRTGTVTTSPIVGWFGLLRYDQIEPLAGQLEGADINTPIPNDELANVLRPFAQSLASLDWLGAADPNHPEELPDLREYKNAERRDSSVIRYVRVDGGLPSDKDDGNVDEADGVQYIRVDPAAPSVDQWVRDRLGRTLTPDGQVRFDSVQPS